MDLVEEKETILLKSFRTWIQNKYSLPGMVRIYRFNIDARSGESSLDEIKGLQFTLRENGTIYVFYDEEVITASGGWGGGANITSGMGIAEPGVGTGGQITETGTIGGDGLGGDAYAYGRITGIAGEGIGGIANGTATSGQGVGGQVAQGLPPTLDHSCGYQGHQ